MRYLAAMRRIVGNMKEHETINKDTAEKMTKAIAVVQSSLDAHGLLVSKKAIDRIGGIFVEGNKLEKSLESTIESFENTLCDELSIKVIYMVSPESAYLLESEKPLFGESANTAFPSSSYDITEAGRCLALSRSTASVMHLMRALEIPLHAMARELGVTLKQDNWGEAINLIEQAIAKISADPDSKSFFSEAATHFRLLKDAWRNHVMHARSKYTEEEADIIFRSVKAFMGQLAKRVRE